MTAERFETLVAALLDGSITDAEQDELNLALENEPERARFLTELLQLEPLLQDAMSQERASGGFPRRVQDAMTSEAHNNTRRLTAAVLEKLQDSALVQNTSKAAPPRSWSRWLIGAASAAAIFVFVLAMNGFFEQVPVAQLDASEARVFVVEGSRESVVSKQTSLFRGQGLRCESGTARVIFADGSFVVVPANCQIQSLSDFYSGQPGPVVVLKSGGFHADVQPQSSGSAFRVVTPSAVIKVIGTRFSVSEEKSATRLDVHEGKVELKRSADGEKVEVVAGYFAVAAADVELTPAPLGKPALSAISYVGDDGNDTIVGAGIQNDGTVVLAANLDGNWEGRTSVELPGATSESKGTLIRLSSNGRSVLSVARVCASISDLSLDAAGAIYLAAEQEGLIKLDASGSRVDWRRSTDLPCVRVDAGADGSVAVLLNTPKGPSRVGLFSFKGEPLNAFAAPYTAYDVAIDSHRRLVFVAGTRTGQTARGDAGAVAYLNAYQWDGSDAWRNYGFDPAMESNLRSHTSCERIAVGGDGKLYAAFLSIGGNSIFARDPKTFSTEVTLGGNDPFSKAYSTGHTYLTFAARFDPLNGDYLAGQLLLGRDSNGKGTDISPVGGGIAADQEGRVYLVGKASFGGPPSRGAWSTKEYSGQEGFLCIFEPDLQRRTLFTTFNKNNQGGSILHCVAVPRRKELLGAYALGGTLAPDSEGVRTLNAIQNTHNKSLEGFFVISGFNGFNNVDGSE